MRTAMAFRIAMIGRFYSTNRATRRRKLVTETGNRKLATGNRLPVQRVEQQLEGSVRLRALEDFRAVEDEMSVADTRVDGEDTAFEILLTPRPAAAQRRRRIEPGERLDAGVGRAGPELEHGTIVEEDVRALAHAGRERVARVDLGAQH